MQPSIARLTLVLSLLPACSGIDPEPFGPPPEQDPQAGIAGFSFDAGAQGDGGKGRSGAAGNQEDWEPVPAGGDGPGEGTPIAGAAGDGRDPSDAGEGGAAGRLGAVSGGAPGVAGAAGAGDGGGSAGGAASGGRGGANSGHAGSNGGRAAASGGRTAANGGSGASSGSAGSAAGVGSSGGAPDDAGHSGGGSAGTASGPPLPSLGELVFSEYVEGSASYKALEIRATTTVSVEGCELARYSNGADSASRRIALDGTLAAGELRVLCSSNLATLLGDVCDRTIGLDFNGNDAVALECGGVILDVIGVVGSDPDTGDWRGEGASTLNQTLRRRCGAGPDSNPTDAFDPALEWLGLPLDTFDGLGDPTCG